jgi:hypothetical protein
VVEGVLELYSQRSGHSPILLFLWLFVKNKVKSVDAAPLLCLRD